MEAVCADVKATLSTAAKSMGLTQVQTIPAIEAVALRIFLSCTAYLPLLHHMSSSSMYVALLHHASSIFMEPNSVG